MQISHGIKIIGLGLWLPKSKTLTITDLQLGNEEMLNKQGIMVPRMNYIEICNRLENDIFPKIDSEIERIVINGDLKHEFGSVSSQEWREASGIIDLLKNHCKKIVLVKGNHDAVLDPIAEAKNVEFVDYLVLPEEKVLFTHGDKQPEKGLLKGIDVIVIGHEHPCITISDGVKRETYKCFLKGKYKGMELIVMPSMNSISLSSDVTRSKTLSPLIKKISEFEVYAVEDKPYRMGKVKDL